MAIALTLLLAISLIIVPSSEAASTWNGGSPSESNWSAASNWDTVPTFPDDLTFDGSTRLDSSNNLSSIQVSSFTFAAGAGAFTLSGNPITLAGDITNSSANTQIINLDMALSGSSLRTIRSPGNAVTLGGVISGPGGFTTNSADNNGTITLSGDNSFSGGVTITSGSGITKTLNIGHANALGTGLLQITAGSTSNNGIDNTSGAAMTIANNVRLSGGKKATRFFGTNDLTINGTFTNANRSEGSIQLDANTLTLTGDVYLTGSIAEAASKLEARGAGNLTIDGVVSNFDGVGGTASGVTNASTGTLTLSNSANTYTGATTIGTGNGVIGATMIVTKLADGGMNSSIGASSNASTNLVAIGAASLGTLRYIGSGDSTDRLFSINSSSPTFKIESSGSGALHFTNLDAMTTAGSGHSDLELGGTYAGVNTMAVQLQGSGAGLSLTKAGAGTWNLTNTNGYIDETTVNAGTLLVSGAGSINSTEEITVNGSGSKFRYTSSTGLSRNVALATGGEFFHSGSTDYSGSLTWTNGVVGGTNWNGASLNNLTVSANRTISPGNSPGTADTVDQTWGTDGSYIWEINDAAGTAGADPGWDLVSGTGTLTISANSTDKFTIYVTSLTLANNPGGADNFSSATDYQWRIADFADPVSGFSADKFAIDTTGFANSFAGTFGVALGDASGIGGDNSQIYLTYAGAIPEPNTALLLGFGLATLLLRRRRA